MNKFEVDHITAAHDVAFTVIEATGLRVDDGDLVILDEYGLPLGAFARGTWSNIRPVVPEEVEA